MPEPEPSRSQITVAVALRRAAEILRKADVAEAARNARSLVAAATGLSPAQLLARPECELSAPQATMLDALLQRRRLGEPMTRILGETEFFGRRFRVAPCVLDPRADSETLVSAALELVAGEGWTGDRLRILDLGTGTGCLLLSLLAELPNARGLGTDISEDALDLARENAERLKLGNRAAWMRADMLDEVSQPFHVLLANPPYIRTSAIPKLEREVRDFDPRLALDGGEDGLVFYRRITSRIPAVVPNGWSVVEVGFDQADEVVALLAAMPARIDTPRVYNDSSGHRRCVAVRTRN